MLELKKCALRLRRLHEVLALMAGLSAFLELGIVLVSLVEIVHDDILGILF